MRRSARWRVKVFRLSPPSRILAIHLAILAGVLGILVLPPVPLSATVQEFYVAPNGRTDGDGSKGRPWDLATALAQPGVVQPGDTIWLRGGVYKGAFVSRLTGAAGAPITVRQYPGERAILDSAGSANPTLGVVGAWATYWGFEVMNSDPQRVTTDTDIRRGNGVQIRAPHTKFINLVVHDTRSGLGFWSEAPDAELYGNLVFYNGWVGPDRGHGHGIYAQNQTGTKRIVDNIVFQNFSHGIHVYSERGFLNNLYTEGNIVFNNGEPAGSFARNVLVGGTGGVVAQNPVLRSNYTYFTPAQGGGENNLGYAAGCRNAVARDNQFVGDGALTLANCVNVVMTGNTFYGRLRGFTPADFPSNTYHTVRPIGVRIFVRPNQYEPGRAHIAIYNWDLVDVVEVDVSNILTFGARYEVRNAQDYYGPPVLTGTYTGLPLPLPLRGLRVAAPIGTVPYKPTTTGPEFAAFVLISYGSEPTPQPSPTATPRPTPTPTSTASPQPSQTPRPTPAPTATPAPQPSQTPRPTPAPTATTTPAPAPSQTPGPTPAPPTTATPVPQPTATLVPQPTPTPKPSGGGSRPSPTPVQGPGAGPSPQPPNVSAPGNPSGSSGSASPAAVPTPVPKGKSGQTAPAASAANTPPAQRATPAPEAYRAAVLTWRELLTNPSFERDANRDGMPDGWTGRHLGPRDALDSATRTRDGRLAFRITGAPGVTKQLVQTIPAGGPAGTLFAVEASNAVTGASGRGGLNQIEVQLVFTDQTTLTVPLTFTPNSSGWQRRGWSFVAPKDFRQVVVRVTWRQQTGIAWFDAIRVWAGHRIPTP